MRKESRVEFSTTRDSCSRSPDWLAVAWATTASQHSGTRKVEHLPGIGLAVKAPSPVPETGYDQGVPRASKHPASDHGETDKQHEVGEELIHRAVPFQQCS